MCGLATSEYRYHLFTGLPDGHLLETTISLYVEDAGTRLMSRIEDLDIPEVELGANKLVVRACGRVARVALPDAWKERFATVEAEDDGMEMLRSRQKPPRGCPERLWCDKSSL